MKDNFTYASDDPGLRQRERELYRIFNPEGPKDGMEYRIVGWVQVSTALLPPDAPAAAPSPRRPA